MLRDQEARLELPAGADARGLFAVLTGAGLWQRDDATRQRQAAQLARAGITTGQLAAAVLAAFDPPPGTGRVNRPPALLRTWIDRGELGRFAPLPLGHELRAELDRRAAERATRDELEAEIAAGVDYFRDLAPELGRREILEIKDQVRAGLIAAGLSDDRERLLCGELVWIVHDRGGGLPELLEFASRVPLPGVLEAFPAALRRVILARPRSARDPGAP